MAFLSDKMNKITATMFCFILLFSAQLSAQIIRAGTDRNLVACTDGRVMSFGYSDGRLGVSEENDTGYVWQRRAILVPNIDSAIGLWFSTTTAIAMKSDGSVYFWGTDNSPYSTIDTFNGDTLPKKLLEPYRLKGVSNISLATSYYHWGVLIRGDTALAFGNTVDQTGVQEDTTKLDHVYEGPWPIRITGLPPVTSFAGISNSGVFLDYEGHLWAFGSNSRGRFGTGSLRWGYQQPFRLTTIDSVTYVGVTYTAHLQLDHFIAIRSDSTLWIWGNNKYGQLGNGTNDAPPIPMPTKVQGLQGVVSASGGAEYIAALTADGRVWTWGRNVHGTLGNGNADPNYTPTPVQGLPPIVQLSAGGFHVLALDANGQYWGWGFNLYYQLNTGDNITHFRPVRINDPCAVISSVHNPPYSKIERGANAFPMPAENELSVVLPEEYSQHEVKEAYIISLPGIVYKSPYQQNERNVVFQTSGLASGAYIAIVQTATQTYRWVFIRQ